MAKKLFLSPSYTIRSQDRLSESVISQQLAKMSFQCPHGVRYNIPVGRGGIESHNVFTWCGRINTSVFFFEVSKEDVFCRWNCSPVFEKKIMRKWKWVKKSCSTKYIKWILKKTVAKLFVAKNNLRGGGQFLFERWPDLLLKASWNFSFSSNFYNNKKLLPGK